MTVNEELLKIMQDYVMFMDSKKTLELPILVSEHKKNHKSSLYYCSPVTAEYEFGQSVFDCEIRDREILSYSFQIRTDKIKSQVALRFDEGDATHFNNVPGLELSEQSVTTPHFHKYNEQGYFIAYKNEELKQLGNVKMTIEDGFDSFCRESKIDYGNVSPRIQIIEDGVMKLNLKQQDPLAGVNF